MNKKVAQLCFGMFLLLSTFICHASDIDDAKNLYESGEKLLNSKPDQAILNYTKLVQHYGDTKDTQLQLVIANALNSKALALYSLSQFNEANDVYDDILQRFNASEIPDIKIICLGAHMNKPENLDLRIPHGFDYATKYAGIFVTKNNELIQAPILADTISQVRSATILLLKADTLVKQNKSKEGITSYDEIISMHTKNHDMNLKLISRVAEMLRIQEALKTFSK